MGLQVMCTTEIFFFYFYKNLTWVSQPTLPLLLLGFPLLLHILFFSFKDFPSLWNDPSYQIDNKVSSFFYLEETYNQNLMIELGGGLNLMKL